MCTHSLYCVLIDTEGREVRNAEFWLQPSGFHGWGSPDDIPSFQVLDPPCERDPVLGGKGRFGWFSALGSFFLCQLRLGYSKAGCSVRLIIRSRTW